MVALGESILPLSTGWLFGRFVPGCDATDFDDSRLATVSVPHHVVDLPWRDWDPDSWEGRWIYRMHFDAGPGWQGRRTFVDFGAAMTHAMPALNGTALQDHLGGYLPFSRELTRPAPARGQPAGGDARLQLQPQCATQPTRAVRGGVRRLLATRRALSAGDAANGPRHLRLRSLRQAGRRSRPGPSTHRVGMHPRRGDHTKGRGDRGRAE